MFYIWINWMRLSMGLDLVPGGPVVKSCDGCDKAVSLMCSVYPNPSIFINRGGCHFNYKPETKKTRKRIGQQKQKKGI